MLDGQSLVGRLVLYGACESKLNVNNIFLFVSVHVNNITLVVDFLLYR